MICTIYRSLIQSLLPYNFHNLPSATYRPVTLHHVCLLYTYPCMHALARGFKGLLQSLKPCRKNLRLATEHPFVVAAYLRNKFCKNHLTLIEDPSTLRNTFGVIPKRHGG